MFFPLYFVFEEIKLGLDAFAEFFAPIVVRDRFFGHVTNHVQDLAGQVPI